MQENDKEKPMAKAYRVRNWNQYNKMLVNRGSITFWFSEEILKIWHKTEKTRGRGRPQKYSDAAIECGLTLKALFKLTFRGTQGFISSLIKALKLEVQMPDYTLLCKRQKDIHVAIGKSELKAGEAINILVDTTGLKIFGEGEWKVRQHGWQKHRIWRKLHLAVNESTQEVENFLLTDLGLQDCQGFSELIEPIKGITSCTGDGAYDRFSCYEQGQKQGFELITPPQRNARTSQERKRNKKKASPEAVKKRDGVIHKVRELGRKEWKIQSNYHRRSLAETAMSRLKTILGNRLSTRKFEHQKVEVAIWCQIINKITASGMPHSVAVN
jgi:hypothetical protein